MPQLLKCYFNLLARDGLPPRSLANIRKAGFDGVQFVLPASSSELKECLALNLDFAASGRINSVEDAKPFAERCAADGFVCATLHVGWGLEDDVQAGRLIESILSASSTYRFPLYVETHRATIFQDMWRTVQFVRHFPELQFNGDFSHWYTGQEMVYGGFQTKLDFIRPVIERVRFIHGRIGNPGCIQVKVDSGQNSEPEYVGHFRQLWTACFQCGAAIFAPELLAPSVYYARSFPQADGTFQEESDRWEQSLVLKRIAEACFAEAQQHA